jgi:hypothetical protein
MSLVLEFEAEVLADLLHNLIIRKKDGQHQSLTV